MGSAPMSFHSPRRFSSRPVTSVMRSFEVLMHSTIAKFCLDRKQHFAFRVNHDCAVAEPINPRPINDVIADSLAYYMEQRKMTQAALASKSGVAQTTISLYLHPSRRQPGKSGKCPSAKVTELAQLAAALGIKSWQLLQDMNPRERAFYAKVEEAYLALAASAEHSE